MELTSAKSPAQMPSQTLGRGLDVLEQVATGDGGLGSIAARLGLSRTTVHRLASSLVERRYLNLTPRRGYSLGPRLLELGGLARDQITLVRAATPIMEQLAEETGDSVVLTVRDGEAGVIAAHVSGRRRLAPRLRVGERQDLRRGAACLALLLDSAAEELAALFEHPAAPEAADLMGRLADSAASGIVLDDLCGDGDIAVMAAPVRGADGSIGAALGLAMAAPYREAGMGSAAREAVKRASVALSAELGWRITNAHDAGEADKAARNLLSCTGPGTSGAVRAQRRSKAAVAATTTLSGGRSL